MNNVNMFLHFVVDDGPDMNIVRHIIDNLVQPENYMHPRQRRAAKTRNVEYFELTIPTYTNDQFKEHFRMTRITFEVCTKLYSIINI